MARRSPPWSKRRTQITDELAVEPEEDSPFAEDMLTDRDPGKEVD